MIIEKVYKGAPALLRGCFSYAQKPRGGVRVKREYRVCPRGCKCVWAECLDGTCFCMLSVCPYTAISDGTRIVSPVEGENGVESRADDLTNRCKDE